MLGAVTIRRESVLWAALLGLAGTAMAVPAEGVPLTQQQWFEARTAHFHTYSCGAPQEVAKLTARLEQFYAAYAMLAGTQAVSSPPIVVMAFPDHAALEPFLPVYQGRPANLAAFFKRDSDENLIALSLSNTGSRALEAVFHEYTHLLLRHNQQFWPLWLQEGMADIYATFEVAGDHSARIGQPMDHYLRLLAQEPLLSLRELFAVTHDSPAYNERERQGMFYAESWLLTDYLMLGDNPAHRARFAQLTPLLRQGQPIEQAFTNAFRTSLAAMERDLRQYLDRGRFVPLVLMVQVSLKGPQALTTRGLTPVETRFRLGDQLLRLGRLEAAESYFAQAQKLAPASPLPYEGLGLLAAERGQHAEAVRYLDNALRRGSASFLAHYSYARERVRLLNGPGDTYSRLGPEDGAEVQRELEKALALMPDFGPAHYLLGVIELVQGESFGAAEQHLQRAIQLEPEHEGYLLTLAEVQLLKHESEAARRTLEPLRRPYVEAQVRRHAEEMLKAISARGQ